LVLTINTHVVTFNHIGVFIMANETTTPAPAVVNAVQAAVVTAKTDVSKAAADVTAAVHDATGFWASIKAHPVTSGVLVAIGAIVGGFVVHLV